MKKGFKYIIFLLILCMTVGFMLSSSLFQIKSIDVSGNIIVNSEEIIRLSSLHYGQNIFRINTKKSMKGIFQNPYIKMIKISRRLPNTINIDIIEREEIALVPYVGSFLNVDEEGMIVKISTSVEKPDLPVVNGLQFDTFKIGEALQISDNKQFIVTVDVISEINKAGLTEMISEVDVSDIYNIKMKTKSDIKVNLGENKKLGYKIAYAKSIIKDVEKSDQKGTIEMSHEGNPIFKPDSTEVKE